MTEDTIQTLRALLRGYAGALDSLADQKLHFWTRRALVGRFLTGHARNTVTALERTLHRQAAVEGDSTLRQPLLDDLEHFRAGLDPGLSTAARTLVGLGVVLVAQLLSRLPAVPIVSGPERKPALGSLNDAVAVDPGHIAKAIADLLGSPLTTICGAVATVAAGGFLVLAVCLPAMWTQGRLVRDSLAELEARACAALGAEPPRRRRPDLLIWWCLPVFGLSLGVAWYMAYLHGLMRQTPGATGRHGAIDVVFRTDRPLLLGLGGLGLAVAGLAIAAVLTVREPQSWAGRVARAPRTLHRRGFALLGGPVVLLAILGPAGAFATIKVPGLHHYRDPLLEVRTSRLRLASLVARPLIPLTLYCHPDRCVIERARILEIDPRDPLDRFASGMDVWVANPLPADSDLPSRPMSTAQAARRLGLPKGRFLRSLRLPAKRIAAERTELVEHTVSQKWLNRTTRAAPAFSHTSFSSLVSELPSAEFTAPPSGYGQAIDSSGQTFEIALANTDLKRLLDDLGRTDGARTPRIQVAVEMPGRPQRDIVLPLSVRL